MKHVVIVLIAILCAAAGWRIGGSMSSDALGMALGVMFGVCAGIPTALMVLAASRRRYEYEMHRERYREASPHTQLPPQPTYRAPMYAPPRTQIVERHHYVEKRVVLVVNERNQVIRREERLIEDGR